MEWLSTTEERSQTVASISRAFEVLRQNPTKCDELAQKAGRKTRSAVENPTDDDLSEIPIVIDVSDQDLEAFPPLTDVDSTDCRKERVEAYLSFSEDLKRRYQEFSSRSDLNACEDLWFNFVMHQDPTITSGSFSSPVRRTPSARLKLGVGNAPTIATAILSARGIGSDVDAVNLYPVLVKYLTDRKAYVAHLTDKDLDGGVGAALHAVLHQLMGPQTQDWGANDVEALYSWYADQTTSVVIDHSRACCAPQPAETSEGAAHKSAPSSSTVSDDKKVQSISRQLRQRRAVVGDEKGSKKPSAATGLLGVGADLFAATKRANQRRPIVLLIQSAERMDVSCFRDLVKLFSVDHPRFPVSLVLGSSVPHDVLTANLSTDVLSRLRLKPLSLQPQKDRLNSFFQDVVLSVSPATLPLVLAHEPMKFLLERYSQTDGSVNALLHAMDLAGMEHCRGEMLAAMAPSCLSGDVEAIEATLAAMPQDAVLKMAESLGCNLSPSMAPKPALGRSRPSAKACRSGEKLEEEKNTASRGRSRSKGAGTGEEVCGPVSSYLTEMAMCMAEAGVTWATWRLGLMWMHEVAKSTDAASRSSDFSLPSLYLSASQPDFMRPEPTHTSAIMATSKGRSLVNQLTGQTSSVSVRRLSQHRPEDGLDPLLDTLEDLATEALQACSAATPIISALEELKRIREPASLSPPAAKGATCCSAVTATAGGGVVGDLLSPVRQALQSVGLQSPQQVPGTEGLPALPSQQPQTATAVVVKGQAMTQEAKRRARKEALLKATLSAATGGSVNSSVNSVVAGGKGSSPLKLGSLLQDRLADFLASTLPKLLSTSPFSKQGARSFLYSGIWELESQLTYAPRAAVHEALLRPHTFMLGPEQDMGVKMESTALAYRLLMGQDMIDIGQWLEEYCRAATEATDNSIILPSVVACPRSKENAADSSEEEEDDEEGEEFVAGATGRGRKKLRGRRRGRRMSPEKEAAEDHSSRGARKLKEAVYSLPAGNRRIHQASTSGGRHQECNGVQAAAARSTQAGSSGHCQSSKYMVMSAVELEAEAMLLAARFSQAAAELQFVGMCRPSKRRKGAAMQKTYYAPESLLAA